MSFERIPLCEPRLGGHEWEYVKSCLDDGWVSSAGPFVERFEQEFALKVGAAHAVSCASGTAAIHVALRIAGVGAGDAVLIPTLTFIAPANAAAYLGAQPIFVDARGDGQIDPGIVAEFLSLRCETSERGPVDRLTGRRVAALLPVHVVGHPCDTSVLAQLGEQHRIPIVEDATEALGATWKAMPVGRAGLFGCFSFNGNKVLTTGGGGMIVTDDASAAARARHLTTQARHDPIEYVHREIGYNYRLSSIASALGCAQLGQLDSFLERKRAIADRYRSAFQTLGDITLLEPSSHGSSSWWLSTAVLAEDETAGDLMVARSRRLLRHLAGGGVEARPLWQPMHRSEAHAGAPALGGMVADRLNRFALCLPSSAGLSTEDQDRVIQLIADFLRNERPHSGSARG